jgi:aspartyl protease family protein
MHAKHCIAAWLFAACGAAFAAEVALVGVIGDRAAVLVLNGGEPKTVKVGEKWRGITVLSVDKERATIEIAGKRQVLLRGPHHRREAAASSRESVSLAADPRGHFVTDGAVSGVPVRFLVDTGATVVALPAADARRLGLDYRKGKRGLVHTANGPADAYLVQLERVRIGPIELTDVDAVVLEQGLSIALLGMSFLNRVEMKRDGAVMTLTRRF